jgi:hypothetical protein
MTPGPSAAIGAVRSGTPIGHRSRNQAWEGGARGEVGEATELRGEVGLLEGPKRTTALWTGTPAGTNSAAGGACGRCSRTGEESGCGASRHGHPARPVWAVWTGGAAWVPACPVGQAQAAAVAQQACLGPLAGSWQPARAGDALATAKRAITSHAMRLCLRLRIL